MEKLRADFAAVALPGDPVVLQCLGISGQCVMLHSDAVLVDERRLQEVFTAQGWEESKSFTWEEMKDLMEALTGPAQEYHCRRKSGWEHRGQ